MHESFYREAHMAIVHLYYTKASLIALLEGGDQYYRP